MKFNLEKSLKETGKTPEEIAGAAGIRVRTLEEYGRRKDIPSKYAYLIWKKIPSFPIPEDFFYYTSFNLQVNMRYHRMTQGEIASLFFLGNQTHVSRLFLRNIPMYEFKPVFRKCFDPMVIAACEDGKPITDLTAGGFRKTSLKVISTISSKEEEK